MRKKCRKLKEQALDGTVWRFSFGRGCGPVVGRLRNYVNGYDDIDDVSEK
jgi:hypothetical protein